MIELYLIFIGIALILFLGIWAYSHMKQRNLAHGKGKEGNYVDPLLAELEQQSDKTRLGSDTPSATEAQIENKDSVKQNAAQPRSEASQLEEAANQKEASPSIDESESKEVASSGDSVQSPKLDAEQSFVTELVARVKIVEAIEQQDLLSLFRLHDYKFHRKVHIYGLNQLTDLWRDVEFEQPSARFVELGISIQLADREGAMTDKELHDFQQMILEYANKFNAEFKFSMDIDEALKQAQVLDQIGRRFDSMAVLNVVPRSKAGFRLADIESCATDLRMTTDQSGIFVKTKGPKQAPTVLYRLACTDGSGHFGVSGSALTSVHDLVLYMSVPATQEPDRVFPEMVEDAKNLAIWLDGKVVDRNGKAMTQRAYSVLLQQISDIVYGMQKEGLSAGDAVSKKLF